MADKLRIALIGCGGMMGAHIDKGYHLLHQAGRRDFEIVACCDVNADAAQRRAEQIGEWQGSQPETRADVQQLVSEGPEFDAADIVVTHRDHHTVTVPVLEAGKHVLLEKPLAFTLRAGKLILEAAGRSGVVLSVAENYRRSPQHRTLHWVVESGRIGDLRQMHWLDIHERRWHWGWRDDLHIAGGGWTLDGGVHFADLMRYHVGSVERVTALSRQYDPVRFVDRGSLSGKTVQATVEDTTMALLEFENGAAGVWVESGAAPGRSVSQQVLYGSEGCLDFGRGLFLRGQDEPTSLPDLERQFEQQLDADLAERWFPFGLRESVAQEINEFFDACQHGTAVETDGMEGYRSQAVCMAVYESAALGNAPVNIADVEALEVEAYQSPLNEGVGL